MSTDVTYNYVRLHNVQTREWSQEIVLDPSGTDLIGHRFTLRFEGIIHIQGALSVAAGAPPCTVTYGPAATAYASSPDLYHEIYNRLTTPRGTLEVTHNGKTVLSCEPSAAGNLTSANRDTNNGPHPVDLKLTHIASEQVYRVEWGVKCEMVKCNPEVAGAGAAANLVVSNRWALGEEMDANFFITRTIRGRMRLSASNATPAHLKKHLVVPGLEDGFRRDRIDFSVAENGLDCDYTVVDKQVKDACPYPGTRFQGSQTESTADGAMAFFTDIRLTMEGPPHVDKRMMITRLMYIVESRLRTWRPTDEWMILSGSVTEHLDQDRNAVEVAVRIQQFPDETKEHSRMANVVRATIGRPLSAADMGPPRPGEAAPYDPKKSPIPKIHGYTPHEGERRASVLALLHCYLQQPCGDDDDHSIGTDAPVVRTLTAGTSLNELENVGPVTPAPSDSIPASLDTGLWSDSARSSIYTMCRAESRYLFRDLKVAMPIAQSDAAAGAGTAATVIANLGRRQCYREVVYEAERIGDHPETPVAPETYTDPNTAGASVPIQGTRIKHEVIILPPKLTADGRKTIHRLLVKYLYALNRPPLDSEKFLVGTLPYTSIPLTGSTGTSISLDGLAGGGTSLWTTP
jgi:hypothetical protein